jgi:2-methylisocitrate lyase-like PEP mutase family enzyme
MALQDDVHSGRALPGERLMERAAAFRSLHLGPRPLMLVNAWDVASAVAVQEAGCEAVATTSGGVAASRGYPDGEVIPAAEMLDIVGRIAAAVDVPVTADLEGGYGLEPAELARRTIEAGAVGLNFEDTDHDGPALVEPDVQAGRIAALRAAAREARVDLFVNARVDVYLRDVVPRERRLEEALARARLYADAGADGIFPIFVTDDREIAALVEGVERPLNVLAVPTAPPPARLAELGVARVSYGSGAMRWTLEALRGLTRERLAEL